MEKRDYLKFIVIGYRENLNIGFLDFKLNVFIIWLCNFYYLFILLMFLLLFVFFVVIKILLCNI